jgi:hypothetical protein
MLLAHGGHHDRHDGRHDWHGGYHRQRRRHPHGRRLERHGRRCGACCTPKTPTQACASIACGTVADGCGGTITCPTTCASGDKCHTNACCAPGCG